MSNKNVILFIIIIIVVLLIIIFVPTPRNEAYEEIVQRCEEVAQIEELVLSTEIVRVSGNYRCLITYQDLTSTELTVTALEALIALRQ